MQAKQRCGATILVISLFALLFASCSRERSSGNTEALRIGAILPLTGEASSYGVDCKRGIELAVSLWTDQKTASIQLTFEDSKADPKEAVSAIRKLINVNRVDAIIGDMFSATTLAIAPIAQDSGILLLTPTASARGIPAAGDKIFSIYPPADAEGGVMAAHLPGTQLGGLVTVRQNLEVFNAIEQGFRAGIEKRKGTVTRAEVLPTDLSSYKNLAAQIASLNPSAVYVAAYKDEAAQIISSAREAGLKCAVYSQSTLLDDQLAKNHQQALEGTVFTGPAFSLHSKRPDIVSFKTAYEKRFGTSPTVWSAYGYDAMMMVCQSTTLAKAKGKPIYQALMGMNYDGLTGRTRLLPDRTAEKEMLLYAIRNGKITREAD